MPGVRSTGSPSVSSSHIRPSSAHRVDQRCELARAPVAERAPAGRRPCAASRAAGAGRRASRVPSARPCRIESRARVGSRAQQQPRAARLDDHRADAVGDDVLQLAADPRALLGDRGPLALLVLAAAAEPRARGTRPRAGWARARAARRTRARGAAAPTKTASARPAGRPRPPAGSARADEAARARRPARRARGATAARRRRRRRAEHATMIPFALAEIVHRAAPAPARPRRCTSSARGGPPSTDGDRRGEEHGATRPSRAGRRPTPDERRAARARAR